MKKILTLAAIAAMALTAMSTVSCTNNDGNDDIKPVVDKTVVFHKDYDIKASSTSEETKTLDAIANLLQTKVGSTGSVKVVKGILEGLCIETTQKNVDAFKQALKNITSGEIDTVVGAVGKVTSVTLSVTYGNEAILKYTYENKSALPTGSWKCSSGGIDYSITYTSTEIGDRKYKATVTVDDKSYEGYYTYNNTGSIFYSNETDTKGPVICAIMHDDQTDANAKIVSLSKSSVILLQEQKFTK